MKKSIFWLIIILAGVIRLGIISDQAFAHVQLQGQAGMEASRSELPVITPLPTVTPSIVLLEPPEDRVLPPVGSNAGLVLGASLLVLIIIGGVLGSRRRVKH